MLGRILFCLVVCYAFIFSSCSKTEEAEEVYELNQEQINVLKTIPAYPIIAHRGTGEWAPEGTEAAMRWARNVGATYLECDIRRTKDGYLVVFHDDNLERTTNLKQKFPSSDKIHIEDFTLEELFSLDAGSWFNEKYKKYSRDTFAQLDILTMEDVIKIAEGYRIKRDVLHKRIYTNINGKITLQYEYDPADNGNRPGIYPETKSPEKYPGIERDIKNELVRLGWYADNTTDLKKINVQPGKVSTANSSARVIIQTLSAESLRELKKTFTRLIPLCYLISINKSTNIDEKLYSDWILTGIKNGAVILGPSISGGPTNFKNLLKPWMHELIKEKRMLIHAYTFYDEEQCQEYFDMVDGFFTGQVSIFRKILKNKYKILATDNTSEKTEAQILDDLGY